MQAIEKIIDLLEKSIKENPENSLTAWEIIADNYDEKVDEYREILDKWQNWLLEYQAKLIKDTWINTLKIKYTNISGYFIEIPKSQSNKVTDYFIQKQTLVNASRYVTLELKKFEEKFLEAQNEKAWREYEIFLWIREQILDSFKEIKDASDKITNLDFLASLAQVAYDNSYVRPKIMHDYNLDVINWRHPIIELNCQEFITNNLNLNNKKYIHIITWPNMWGKSTFLRQNALIILMAHIGSFVPASSASIPLTDKIFSRVGASDNLFLWQSTFMVEMQEVAYILNNATKKSFVIIDEVWRWTSTYDGMSLAWAILKELHDNIKVKTLFATHYHELIDDSKDLGGVLNFSVAVWENEDRLVFLRKVIQWGIKKSFWLEVAKIAWIWDSVIKTAQQMLNNLEWTHNSLEWKQLSLWTRTLVEYREKDSKVEQKLKNIDLNNLTPIEALNKLSELKNTLNEK